MESAKAEAVAGEGKAVTSERFRYEETSCGALERDEAETGENSFRGAERQGAQRFGTQCSGRLHARGEQGWKSAGLDGVDCRKPWLVGSTLKEDQNTTGNRLTAMLGMMRSFASPMHMPLAA